MSNDISLVAAIHRLICPGTVSIRPLGYTYARTCVDGCGTVFTHTFAPGDRIRIGGEEREVLEVVSDWMLWTEPWSLRCEHVHYGAEIVAPGVTIYSPAF